MIRRPPRSTQSRSSAASDVYKRQAARAIAFLKENNAGRATFLPLNKLKPVHRETLQARDGIIDYAINLIQFDPAYTAAFSYVFGRTVVVTELETARDLIGKYRMVTLEGELLEVSGAMTGGIDRRALKFIAGDEKELHKLCLLYTSPSPRD